MQNKQAIFGIIAAVVILLGAGGVFLYSRNKPAQPQPNSTTVQTSQENTQSSMSGSLASLLKSGKTQQCTFSYSDSNGNTRGTAYIASDKMRTDLTIISNGKQSNVYVIRNGDDNYIWGSEFPDNAGLKMKLSIEEYENNTDSRKYFDPTKKVDYDCSGWTLDSSVFTPPSNVKFSDLSQMIQSMMGTTKTPTGAVQPTSQCSVCNSLTGDAKTACLQQLGC